jgi:hypothetical protein
MPGFRPLLFGIILIIGFISPAEAINIKMAEVQNGVVVVKGSKAVPNADIFWEGAKVAQANQGGNFSFSALGRYSYALILRCA